MHGKNLLLVPGAIAPSIKESIALGFGLLLVMSTAFPGVADAACGCSGGGGTWGGAGDWLNDFLTPTDWASLGLSPSYEALADESTTTGSTAEGSTVADATVDASKPVASDGAEVTDEKKTITISPADLLSDMNGDSKYLIIYTDNIKSDSYIKGSVFLPSGNLIDGSVLLKSIADLADLLGAAGISEDDSLVVYGCWDCGNPTFVLWALTYLGQGNVLILEGTMEDWVSAGIPMEEMPGVRSPVIYTPNPKPELLASNEDVMADGVMLVDARSAEDFEAEHIDGAINIEHQLLIDDGFFVDDGTLAELFKDLRSDGKVIVYSERGGKASVVWCALEKMGYSASLYSWEDWLLNWAPDGVAENSSPSIA